MSESLFESVVESYNAANRRSEFSAITRGAILGTLANLYTAMGHRAFVGFFGRSVLGLTGYLQAIQHEQALAFRGYAPRNVPAPNFLDDVPPDQSYGHGKGRGRTPGNRLNLSPPMRASVSPDTELGLLDETEEPGAGLSGSTATPSETEASGGSAFPDAASLPYGGAPSSGPTITINGVTHSTYSYGIPGAISIAAQGRWGGQALHNFAPGQPDAPPAQSEDQSEGPGPDF